MIQKISILFYKKSGERRKLLPQLLYKNIIKQKSLWEQKLLILCESLAYGEWCEIVHESCDSIMILLVQ